MIHKTFYLRKTFKVFDKQITSFEIKGVYLKILK